MIAGLCKKHVSILLLWGALAQAHTPREGKVYGSGGALIYQTHDLQTRSWLAPHVTAGIQAEGDVDSRGGLIAELYYYTKYYERGLGGGLVTSSVDKLEIQLGYRYWLWEKFSMGLALAPAYSVGPYKVISNSSSGDQSTLASQITDYGLVMSFQYETFTTEKFVGVVDARYSWSLSANPGEDANQYALFFGLKFLVHDKKAEK